MGNLETRPQCVQEPLCSDSERETTNFFWSIFEELIWRVCPLRWWKKRRI